MRNSFPDLTVRINFLNHFYQCLLYGQLPLKARKLVAVGDSDSGKSSWAKVLSGLVPENKTATISKEKVFGTSLIDESTQLIYIDEWSVNTLSSEDAKILLQGGQYTVARKHKAPAMINNRAGMYITCNVLPDFKEEQGNIERRLAIYQTKSLTEKNVEAPEWMQRNAFQCLIWIINEINRNINLVNEDERFYEKNYNEMQPRVNLLAIPKNELEKLMAVSVADLSQFSVERTNQTNDRDFEKEFVVKETNDGKCCFIK